MNTNKLIAITAAVAGLILTSATASQAKGCFAGNHPRRAEVLHNDRSLNQQILNDRGHLGGHFNQLESEDRSIRRQEQRDARINGGYITKGQQAQLNGEEARLQGQMNRDYRNASAPGTFAYNHPRRSQVIGDDRSLNRELNHDYGNLGGNYGALKQEDRSIFKQEQADARANGGFITTAQQRQLDNEEAGLQNQINKDFK